MVTDTPVCSDLLEALNVLTELRVDVVGQDLVVLAVDDVLLPVEEPGGDLELGRVLEDLDNSLELVRVELTSTVDEWTRVTVSIPLNVIILCMINLYPAPPTQTREVGLLVVLLTNPLDLTSKIPPQLSNETHVCPCHEPHSSATSRLSPCLMKAPPQRLQQPSPPFTFIPYL